MFFEIYKSAESGMYFWEAKSEDERTLCSSEPMPSRETCLATILIVKHGAASASVHDQTGDQRSSLKARRIIA